MIQRLMHALVVLVAAATFGFAAQAQQIQSQARFAFVIGNDGYEGAEMPTAANDAALVADMLKSAGFDVTGARNLDQETLRASYREFLEKVAAGGPDSVAFVYLSGFGMQSDGENFFIPPGARIARAADLALNGVRLSDITRSLGGLPAQARIMVFDVAYPGPFAREGQAPPPGLAIMDAGPGDLIAFNAAPGAVAPIGQPPYGAFAQALAEMAREPGTPIADVFDRVRVRVAELTRGAQVPWRESRIDRPIILFDRGADAPAPAVSQAELEARRARPLRDVSEAEAYALALDRDTIRGYEEFLAAYPSSPYARNVRNILAARREAVTWRRAVQANTAAAYWSYLDRYPKGPNASAARTRLSRMQAALDPPARYDAMDFEIAPPSAYENEYFAEDGPGYFAAVEAPVDVVYVAPRPTWWSPPPPPVYVDDSYYFLPMPGPVVAPGWIAPPVYVVEPPPPLVVLPPEPGYAISPYVAAPVALAAGLAAGSIIYRRDRLARPGAGPGRPFLPPVAPPPRGRPQTLPAALQQQNLQNFQQRPRPQFQGGRPGQQLPGSLPGQQGGRPGQQGFQPGQPGGRPGQQGLMPGQQGGGQPGMRPGQQGFQPGQPGGRPGQQGVMPGQQGGGQPGMRPGQQGFQPGQPGGRPGQQGVMPGQQGGGQPGMRPGQQGFQPGQPGGRPGQQGVMPGQQGGGQPGMRPGQQGLMPGQAGGQGQQRPMTPQMQRQQQLQQQRDQQMQRQQQQQQLRQQQQQQQRDRQQQMQQQRQQQMQQQQQRQQQQQQQQRQQQMQQQQQRQQQMQQQQQRQQQMQQQQRQQQMQQQQQRQQQMQQQQRQQQMQMQQQRQQQQMQQQRQQQMQQQRQQQQQRQPCGRPGLPACR